MDSHCIDTLYNLIINWPLIIANLFLCQIALRGIGAQAESLTESDQTSVTDVATLIAEVVTLMTKVAGLVIEIVNFLINVSNK